MLVTNTKGLLYKQRPAIYTRILRSLYLEEKVNICPARAQRCVTFITLKKAKNQGPENQRPENQRPKDQRPENRRPKITEQPF